MNFGGLGLVLAGFAFVLVVFSFFIPSVNYQDDLDDYCGHGWFSKTMRRAVVVGGVVAGLVFLFFFGEGMQTAMTGQVPTMPDWVSQVGPVLRVVFYFLVFIVGAEGIALYKGWSFKDALLVVLGLGMAAVLTYLVFACAGGALLVGTEAAVRS